MRYQKPLKVEIHVHLEQKEKSSLSKELLIAVVSALVGAVTTSLLS